MYLPESKYEVKTAKVGEYTYKGRPFYGRYIETYRGARYPGSDIGQVKASDEQLVPASTEQQALSVLSDVQLGGCKIVPTEEDYGKGSFTRYFQRNKVSGKVDEISKDLYEDRQDLDYLTFATCSWALTGSVENHYVGQYYMRGAGSRNREQIEILEESMPGVGQFLLRNPGEFVRETWK